MISQSTRKLKRRCGRPPCKWQHTFDADSDAICLLDADQRILRCNHTMTQMFGVSREEIIGRHCWEIVHCTTEPIPPCPTRCLRSSLRREEMELQAGGRWFYVTVDPMLDEAQRLQGIVHIIRDITSRKRMEETLQASEERHRLLVENANEAITVVQDAVLKFVNPKFAKLTGYSEKELVGKTFIGLIHPDDRQKVARYNARRLKGEEVPHTYQSRFLDKQGLTRWAETNAVLFEWEGRPATLALLNDITERREAEESLRVSEGKYRLLTEKMNDVIWTTDLNLRTTYTSSSVEKMLGFTPEERLGQTPEAQMTPESLARVQELLLEQLELEREHKGDPNRSVRIELEFYRKDGSTVWLEHQVSGIRDADGTLIAMHGVARDISERKKAKEALVASEIKYRNLFEHTLLGMEVIDAETGKVVLANHAIARMFGFNSPEEMVGLDAITGWVLPEDMEWVLREFAKAMADPEKRDVATLRVRGKDGHMVWVSGSGTLFDYEGKPAILISLIDVTAAKEAEAKLHESEEKNRLLVENANEAITVVQDAVLKFANPKFAQLTGYSEKDLVGKTFVELLHPDDRQMVAEYYARRLKGEEVPYIYQFKFFDKQGLTKWAEINAVLFEWEGRPAILALLNDITERKEAQKALKESEERFRTLIEKSTDAITILDATGRLLYESASMERITGYKLEDWLGKPIGDWFLHPDDLVALASLLERVIGEPDTTVEGVTARFKHKDGRWHVLEATVRNLLDDPKVGGIVVNYRDITERVIAEQVLRESEERYRLFADNVSDVIWVMDMNLKPIYVSPSVSRMMGYSMDQAMSGAVETRLTPASAQIALQAYADAMAKEAQEPGSEWDSPPLDLQAVRSDGSTVWIAAKFSFIRADDGKPFAIVGVLRDITERKKAENELRNSEERFRGLVETTSDWVWETDQKHRYTYVSPKVRDILGYEPQDLLGRTPFEFMHQREGRRVAKIVRRFAERTSAILPAGEHLHPQRRPPGSPGDQRSPHP